MIYKYIYGRLGDGYTCINKDELPFLNRDYDQLKNFISYERPEDISEEDLPDEFYFYNDELSIGRVGILGRTCFVKGGAGVSGARDTSFSQKYIFTGEDYDRLLNGTAEMFTARSYFGSADEYLANHISLEYPLINEKYKTQTSEKLGLSENEFVLLLYCCIDAFADSEKRVYIMLPENDKCGSMTATVIMQAIFDAIPSFLLANAGFMTYAPTFDSNTMNPIPNSVSVVFIKRNAENIYRAGRIPGKNYLFDFTNNVFPNCRIDDNTFNTIYAIWKNENIKRVINSCLSGIFSRGTSIKAEIFAHLLVLAKELPDVDEWNRDSLDKQLEEKKDAVLFIINNNAGGLEQDGISMLDNNVKLILKKSRFDERYLDFVGDLYSSTGEYREMLLNTLCDRALERAEADDEDGVLDITDFEYSDELLNDDILDKAYSDKKYFPIGEVLFLNSVEPVMLKSTISFQDRLTKVFKFVIGQFSKEYKDFFDYFCEDYVEDVISDYLDAFVKELRSKLDGKTESTKIVIGAKQYELVVRMEEFLNPYVEDMGEVFKAFVGKICKNDIMGLEGNYKILTAPESKELMEGWKEYYGF